MFFSPSLFGSNTLAFIHYTLSIVKKPPLKLDVKYKHKVGETKVKRLSVLYFVVDKRQELYGDSSRELYRTETFNQWSQNLRQRKRYPRSSTRHRQTKVLRGPVKIYKG